MINGLSLRFRLLRKTAYGVWKSHLVSKAKNYISVVKCENDSVLALDSPAIILSSFNKLEDFMILNYLFKSSMLTFVSPRELPNDVRIQRLQSINQMIYFDRSRIDYRFLRSVIRTLRDYNRAIVLAPDAVREFAQDVILEPAAIIRIAIYANAPFVPVKLDWKKESGKIDASKCDVAVGDKLFVSPRTPLFKDIFFKRRGFRKFSDLPHEDLNEIGRRIMNQVGCG